MTYSEKLRSPLWQKKRLEILNRDEFTCQLCGDNISTLHVHHKEYIKGRDPWQYNNFYLITLCEECHSIEENIIKKKKELYERLQIKYQDIYKCCPACGCGNKKMYNLHDMTCPVCGFFVEYKTITITETINNV